MSKFLFTYITCGSEAEAKKIGKHLVEKRLAACANILKGMTSVYWWEGKVVEDNEVVLIAKTTLEKQPALENSVKEIHSYSVPCIIFIPIESGHAPYLEWLSKETQAGAGNKE